jgi:signal transduction histidine kinase
MKVEQVGISGTPLKTVYSIEVKVPLPLWKNPFFWLAIGIAVIVITTLVVRHLIRKKFRLHVQQTQLIAEERFRIARDLHDDLGTRLSHISLLGSYAESTITDVADARASFEQITGMSRELITALSQTVWMLSSKNDKLDALIDFLCRLVSELCRPSGIRCRIDALPVKHDVPITSEVRHNLSLAFKEAVNNSLKHSAATEIQIRIRFEASVLKVSVADDGVGLTEEQKNQGNGLDNIKQRMNAIHGRCSITESESGGVIVDLEVPIVSL